jgi:peptidyl-prolyl cis-trans isomerase D
MLTALRSRAGGLVAKAFIILLAASFAVWGIADVFSGRQSEVVAEVGTRTVSAPEFSNAFNRQLRVLSSQIGQPLTPAQGREFGLHRQVLGQLVRDATLEAQADTLNLNVSPKAIAQRIADNAQFQGADGSFNADQFRRLLQSAGLSEQAFVAAERQGLLRGFITDSISQGLAPPRTLAGIAHKHRTEQRDASFFTITGKTQDIADPSDDELKKFYDGNPRLFAVPERRAMTVLQVTPATLANQMQATDEELRDYYERRANDYGTPEKRTIQQIAFTSQADAKAAYDKIEAGAKFEDIARERGLNDKDLSLGTVTKPELPDKIIADAAFSLAKDQVSEPVTGKLSTALLRVTAIEPGQQKSFDEVRDEVAKLVKLDKARDAVLDVHDKVEDGRAGGQTLQDIAKQLSLSLVQTPLLDASGADETGTPYSGDLSEMANIVGAAFDSDIGVDNDPLTTDREGFTWFIVNDVKSASTQPLDEVRNKAINSWKARQLRSKLLEQADALKKRLVGGESLEALAQELGVEIKKQTGLQRNEASEAFPAAAVNALFAAPENGFAVALESNGEGARVMQSTPVFAAPFDANSDEAKAITQVLSTGITNDLYAGYLTALQSEIGVTINDAAFNYAAGVQTGGAPASGS